MTKIKLIKHFVKEHPETIVLELLYKGYIIDSYNEKGDGFELQLYKMPETFFQYFLERSSKSFELGEENKKLKNFMKNQGQLIENLREEINKKPIITNKEIKAQTPSETPPEDNLKPSDEQLLSFKRDTPEFMKYAKSRECFCGKEKRCDSNGCAEHKKESKQTNAREKCGMEEAWKKVYSKWKGCKTPTKVV